MLDIFWSSNIGLTSLYDLGPKTEHVNLVTTIISQDKNVAGNYINKVDEKCLQWKQEFLIKYLLYLATLPKHPRQS